MAILQDSEGRRQNDFNFGAFHAYFSRVRLPDTDSSHLSLPFNLPDQQGLLELKRTRLFDNVLVSVAVDSEMNHFSKLDLLKYFWKNGPDTPCAHCGRDFSNTNPPVRTIALDPISKESGNGRVQKPRIVVINRHLDCIREAQIPFISISHVWHPAISQAHLTGQTSSHGADCLLEVVLEMLPVITKTFEPSSKVVEIWHDYLSVPQWTRDVQQSLLLLLPEIYSSSTTTIFHLADVLADTIAGAAAYDTEYDALGNVFRAQWFTRMWVSLEYANCTRAFLYTADDVIVGNPTESHNPFTYLLDGLQQKLRKVFESNPEETLEHFSDTPIPLTGPLADMRESVHNGRALTFGEALCFVAARECQNYRDRFLAMVGFLNLTPSSRGKLDLPNDPAAACIEVMKLCLERGDYSPLLLISDILDSRSATCSQALRWGSGYGSMHSWMWDLGTQVSPPVSETIDVRGNNLSVELESVGHVDSFSVWEPSGEISESVPLSNLQGTLTLLLDESGLVDPRDLISALKRTFAVPRFIRNPQAPLAFNEYNKAIHNFEARLRNLMHLYKAARDEESRYQCTLELAKFLKFHDPLAGTAGSFSRLTFSTIPTGSSFAYYDGVGTVHCDGCKGHFAYRFLLRKDTLRMIKSADHSIKLYRIPGLQYQRSLPDGVGFLVLGGTIVGRMAYGTPACGCHVQERVEIRGEQNVVTRRPKRSWAAPHEVYPGGARLFHPLVLAGSANVPKRSRARPADFEKLLTSHQRQFSSWTTTQPRTPSRLGPSQPSKAIDIPSTSRASSYPGGNDLMLRRTLELQRGVVTQRYGLGFSRPAASERANLCNLASIKSTPQLPVKAQRRTLIWSPAISVIQRVRTLARVF